MKKAMTIFSLLSISLMALPSRPEKTIHEKSVFDTRKVFVPVQPKQVATNWTCPIVLGVIGPLGYFFVKQECWDFWTQ